MNTDHDRTGWTLYAIPHIREDLFNNSNDNHIKQVNTSINNVFPNLSDGELHDKIDTFWI